MERFPASAWTDTKEISVVRHLYLAFLAGDVNTDGKPLSIGIVSGQRCIFRTFQVLFEKEAQGGIRKCQEQVIIGIKGVGVARKTVGKQFQLVVGCP